MFKVDTQIDVAVVPSKLDLQAMRASGPGGQNVNKTNSAVRARDIVTGEVVTASLHRSQAQNRRAAVRKIAQRLVDKAEEANSAREQSRWVSIRSLYAVIRLAFFMTKGSAHESINQLR